MDSSTNSISMKSIQLIYMLWFLCTPLICGTLQAQGKKVELIMEDGTAMKGYAKFYTKSFSYRANENERFKRFKMLDFETIRVFLENNDTKTYKRIKINDHKKPKMLILLVEGPVSLYLEEKQIYSSGYGAGLGVSGNAGQSVGGSSYSYSRLYLKRNKKENATHMSSTSKKKFKAFIKNYFKDCTDLVMKVEEGKYSKKELKEIVEFYNNECK
ncbi:MAG: hypothetical protein CMH44_06685 [Muricauda sp.]|nr:hypothetical protein [Allomuricauda sp.]